ncbi:fucosyl transferase [Ancylostoma duodenale]|uniref:Fucosyltransferase n=1 Tax=Ancylostoma duodenale TaxID=51022 RepID=A0A0C2DE44_9BILA|nr:fucosyl transferase [Ancylostoma duodenale]
MAQILRNRKVPPNFFNATITYRRDSRYFYPYGHFSPLLPNDDNSSIITEEQVLVAVKKKNRGSLIFVSNCHTNSKRENVIRELGRFTEVTVRGGCEKQLLVNTKLSSSSCSSGCSDNELIATHRFYIAFENSICNDYITEKFFMRASQMLVPVVMRRRYYERAGIPPSAFIALDDFRTVRELGQYLTHLRNNDTAYMKWGREEGVGWPRADRTERRLVPCPGKMSEH